MTYQFSSRKIEINGEVYDSLEEVPEEHRELLNSLMDFDYSGDGAIRESVYMHNGIEYASLEDLPEDAMQFIVENDFSLNQTFIDGVAVDSNNQHKASEVRKKLLESLRGAVAEVSPEQSFEPKSFRESQKINENDVPNKPHRQASTKQSTHHVAPQKTHYSSAVQKQSQSYGWISAVVIVALLGVIIWQFLS